MWPTRVSRSAAIELLAPEERRQLLFEWNATARDVPQLTLPALFEAQVERSPEAIALVFEESTLSYAELNAQANRLAHLLIGRGIGPESLVALALPRSTEMVVALLGILKAGAAYLPLDPDYPVERLSYMLRDAQPACVLTSSPDRRALACRRASLSSARSPDTVSALAQSPETNPSDAERTQPLSPHNPAYVIYTSGSTGTPKGVVVTHSGIPSLAAAQIKHFAVTAEARVLQFASLSFDATLWEFAMALVSGAALVLTEVRERSGERTSRTDPKPRSHACDVDHQQLLASLAAKTASRSRHLSSPVRLFARIWSADGPRGDGWSMPTARPRPRSAQPSSAPLSGCGRMPPIGRPIWNTRVMCWMGPAAGAGGCDGGALHCRGGVGAGLPEAPGLKRRALCG